MTNYIHAIERAPCAAFRISRSVASTREGAPAPQRPASCSSTHSGSGVLRGIFSEQDHQASAAMNEEQDMQALTTPLTGMNSWGALERRPANAERRSSRVAAVVVAIYLALVIATPLIVRYGPAPEDHAAAAFAERIDQPRCSRATASDLRCAHTTTSDAFRARGTGDL
jgi:hypothetical protein